MQAVGCSGVNASIQAGGLIMGNTNEFYDEDEKVENCECERAYVRVGRILNYEHMILRGWLHA